MKTIILNNFNSTFRVHGNDATRSLNLKSIKVEQWPAAGTLTLVVTDEKDVPVYSKELVQQPGVGPDIPIHEKFVFYDHLAVHMQAGSAGDAYAVVLVYE